MIRKITGLLTDEKIIFQSPTFVTPTLSPTLLRLSRTISVDGGDVDKTRKGRTKLQLLPQSFQNAMIWVFDVGKIDDVRGDHGNVVMKGATICITGHIIFVR